MNLAKAPEQQATLKRLRDVLDKWIVEVKDQGITPEVSPGGEKAIQEKKPRKTTK